MKLPTALALLPLHADQPFWLRRELVRERQALLLAVGLVCLLPDRLAPGSGRRRRVRA